VSTSDTFDARQRHQSYCSISFKTQQMSSSKVTDQDRVCAAFAKAALFPKRMHRDVAHAAHFPALLQLDLLRDKFLSDTAVSSVFPRHVVVVRNLADDTIQWNGEPDMEGAGGNKFDVIPGHVSVTCHSNACDALKLDKKQRAFVRASSSSSSSGGKEIVLCSDRILQSDHKDTKYKGVAKELPPKTMQAVEEVLAHELVKVRNEVATDQKTPAAVELEAAKAAECYFSRHTYDETHQIKKGTRLQTGYSWLPGAIKTWSMNKCLEAVAMENLVRRSMSKQDASAAVKAAMKEME
jgi:hypothetical protein